LYFLKRRELF